MPLAPLEGPQGLSVHHTQKTLRVPELTHQHRQQRLSRTLHWPGDTSDARPQGYPGNQGNIPQFCRRWRPIRAKAPPKLPRSSSIMDKSVLMCFLLPALHCGKVSLSTAVLAFVFEATLTFLNAMTEIWHKDVGEEVCQFAIIQNLSSWRVKRLDEAACLLA